MEFRSIGELLNEALSRRDVTAHDGLRQAAPGRRQRAGLLFLLDSDGRTHRTLGASATPLLTDHPIGSAQRQRHDSERQIGDERTGENRVVADPR